MLWNIWRSAEELHRLSGGLLGAMVGLLFLNPAAGLFIGGMIGAGAGALSGSLSDYGIPDDFIRSLAEAIPEWPNSSTAHCNYDKLGYAITLMIMRTLAHPE